MSRFFFGATRARLRGPTDADAGAWAARHRAGDASAREEVFRFLTQEGVPLADRLKRKYPAVAMMEETGDLVQEALTKLFRRFDVEPGRLPETVSGLRLALRGAIDDVLIDACRKHLGPHGWRHNHVLADQAGLDIDVDAEWTGVTGQARRNEAESLLARAIEELPDDQREAVLLHDCQGLTFEEVGRRLGVHPKTASGLYYRALETLRARLRGVDPKAH